MRIAITGSTGQLGRELARTLGGQELFLLSRPEFDLQDRQAIWKIVEIGPEVVIHAAAMTDVDACELNPELARQVNALATRDVAEAAERAGAKLLYISTDYVFDGGKREPYREEDPPKPINAYGRSKLEGEQYVREYASRPLILRTSWLYSGGSKNFVSAILRLAREQETVRVVIDQSGSPTWAGDLAGAIRRLLSLDASGLIHASGGGECSRLEFARAIVQLAGLKTEVLPATSEEQPRPARRPAYSALAQHRLNELGISIRPWREGLEAFFTRGAGGDPEDPLQRWG